MFSCRNVYWLEILLTGIITAGNFSAGNFTDWKVYRWKYYYQKEQRLLHLQETAMDGHQDTQEIGLSAAKKKKENIATC